jgi:hypothetical protein
MKKWIFIVIPLVIVSGVTGGCLGSDTSGSPTGPVVSPTPATGVPLTLHINATPPRYNPAMSSTIGIRLTPVNTSGVFSPDVQFTWETNSGTFYHWGPPDFKVVELGPTYTGTAEPVYWSYFSEHGEKYRRPVSITVSVHEPSSEEIIASATLGIGWEDPLGFTAIVENSG